VFCDATATPRTYVLRNDGHGQLRVNKIELESDEYFAVTPPQTKTIAPNGSLLLEIKPKQIKATKIEGPADLGQDSAKFSTTLTISTDALNPDDLMTPTVIRVPLKMYAQGIIIQAPGQTLWDYGQVLWPADRQGSYNTSITNLGNVDGEARLAAPLKSPNGSYFYFYLASDPQILPGHTSTTVRSTFGGEVFEDCNTSSGNYGVRGTLHIAADLSQARRQDLGGSKGVCQVVTTEYDGEWFQRIDLTGTVSRTASMCLAGQECGSAGACICTAKSCEYGCCTAQDLCQESTASHCGSKGAACVACNGTKSVCTLGTCTCSDGLADCGGQCVDFSTNKNHCGSCYNECDDCCIGGICQLCPSPAP